MQEGTLSLQNIIEQVSREKGIDPKILVETMEQAILTAAKRTFGVNRELEARFNGTLVGVNGDHVVLEQDGQVVEIPHKQITKAHLVHQF